MNKNNNTILLIICISLLIAFVLIAIVFSIWPGHTFISQIVAALASAMVVSIITLLLLQGQTANEEIKERNTKVFQEKLKIYNDFYQKLCGIVNDGKITSQEEIELQFQVATLTMHTEANNIAAISEQVKELITLIKHPDFSRKLESHNILKPLFEIDKVFRKELYGNDFDLTKDNQCVEDRNCAYEKAYNNFMSIVVNNADIDAYNQALEIQSKLHGRVQGTKHMLTEEAILVHILYTERNKNGVPASSNHNIILDLKPQDGGFVLDMRVDNDTEATKEMGVEINKKHPLVDLRAERPVICKFDKNSSAEEIADEIVRSIENLKDFRTQKFNIK